jgi:uncharacterized protein
LDPLQVAFDRAHRDKRAGVPVQWTWVGNRSRRLHKRRIEEALHRFERFQLRLE